MLALLAALGGPIAGLFTKNVSYKMAKVVGGITLAVLLVGGFFIAKAIYDRNLISNHDAGRSAQIANDTVAADRAADEEAAKRQAEFEASQANIADAAAKARAADPEGAAKPVGPVSKSYYDTLPEKKK